MEINFDKKEKVDVLISALEERYKSIHTIRERIQNICLWALGIFFAAGGWIIQSRLILFLPAKIIFIGAVIIIFFSIKNYLNDLKQGFKSQQCVAVRLEKALGFFTPKVFDDSTESIYPKGWENTGTENGEGKFFQTTFNLLNIGFWFLIASILLKGCFF